jgi:tripartite-type tricarboxylate transporter receptor subunit TctC
MPSLTQQANQDHCSVCPGGTSDILARALGIKLTEAWGKPVVVENEAGATGNVGADFVAKAPADGHTLL